LFWPVQFRENELKGNATCRTATEGNREGNERKKFAHTHARQRLW
jgi:hypothetical protein